jgi:membrane-associated protease RseP (regulator of RpoE activity)
MFGLPGPTEFDVRFRLLGIPVRVHPLFWAMAAILGWNLTSAGGTFLLLWVACVFFSILVHEFGHALTARAFGADPSVLLYAFGGLCVYESGYVRETSWRRFAVLAMGPGAGFLLMAAAIAGGAVRFHATPLDMWEGNFLPGSGYAGAMIYFLILINFTWGIFNLLPIMPLDGGQMASVLLTAQNRREGPRRSYILSLVAAGLGALYFVHEEQYPNAILMGMLALSSFQVLQVLHQQSRYGGYGDGSDWWKR